MNKVWSELNKTVQAQIRKEDTYKAGIDTLIDLRNQLIDVYKRQELHVLPCLASYRTVLR